MNYVTVFWRWDGIKQEEEGGIWSMKNKEGWSSRKYEGESAMRIRIVLLLPVSTNCFIVELFWQASREFMKDLNVYATRSASYCIRVCCALLLNISMNRLYNPLPTHAEFLSLPVNQPTHTILNNNSNNNNCWFAIVYCAPLLSCTTRWFDGHLTQEECDLLLSLVYWSVWNSRDEVLNQWNLKLFSCFTLSTSLWILLGKAHKTPLVKKWTHLYLYNRLC